jgi:hypothetical protein
MLGGSLIVGCEEVYDARRPSNCRMSGDFLII